MTKLRNRCRDHGQSPRLDNLTRPYPRDGRLEGMVAAGTRGVAANPTIFAKATECSDAYDDRFRSLMALGHSVPDGYWELAIDDTTDALGILRSTFEESGGTDGFVSLEVSSELAHDAEATVTAARDLHQRISLPNLFGRIPAARTIDTGVDQAHRLMNGLGDVGVDMEAVGLTLEERGVASFRESFAGFLHALDSKAEQLVSH